MRFDVFAILIVSVGGVFNPFSDEELFAIHWAGSIDFEKLKKDDAGLEMLTVQTEHNEKYQCVIPESQALIDSSRKVAYHGPTAEQLIEELHSLSYCSVKLDTYWTYELCHGKHVRQYYAANKRLGLSNPILQEYYLGRMGAEKSGRKDTKEPEKPADQEQETVVKSTKDTSQDGKYKPQQDFLSVKIDGLDLPYLSVNMTDGSFCDLTGKPRVSHIKYVCHPSFLAEIYQLKEASSCEYDIIILTDKLCSHPAFMPKEPPVSKINCHPEVGSPFKPMRLQQLESDRGLLLEPEQVKEVIDLNEPSTSQPVPESVSKPPKTNPRNQEIGVQTDKQLLRDFLNGDYCIHGGGGWWKHEFCYNKYAKQYHEDASVVSSIHLGRWDKDKHLAWLKKNPGKRPKPVGFRKSLSILYTDGDTCDLTGKPRFVEVKLKCLQQTNQPHAVSIYLVEPNTCEYVLGVESPLFCDILDKADNDGLLDHIKI